MSRVRRPRSVDVVVLKGLESISKCNLEEVDKVGAKACVAATFKD